MSLAAHVSSKHCECKICLAEKKRRAEFDMQIRRERSMHAKPPSPEHTIYVGAYFRRDKRHLKNEPLLKQFLYALASDLSYLAKQSTKNGAK